MRARYSHKAKGRRVVAVVVALAFLTLLPFAGALEIHHVFAEVDHDGHEHSEFDLCQWVQAHGSGSVDLDHSSIGIPLHVDHVRWHIPAAVVSSRFLSFHETRGPPLFL